MPCSGFVTETVQIAHTVLAVAEQCLCVKQAEVHKELRGGTMREAELC